MKTPLFASVLVLSALLAVGCSNKKQTISEVPPPTTDIYVADPMPAPTMVYASTPAPTSTAGQSYTVQRGDTLWSIAQRTYGDGKRYHDIVSANPGLQPTKLAVGQTIRLP